MAFERKQHYTPEEYLARERQALSRSEYLNGEIFAMTGASRRHNRIVTNLVVGLDLQLKTRPRNVYATDLRVRVPATGLYTYPDVIVTCGEELLETDQLDVLLNPLVLIEVLSDSTEAYDRGAKFRHYQQLESLAEYLLVAQAPYQIEQFIRQADEQWLYRAAHGPEGLIKLPSLDCELALRDVYDKV